MTALLVVIAIVILTLVPLGSYELGRRQGREEGASPLGPFDVFVVSKPFIDVGFVRHDALGVVADNPRRVSQLP